MPITRTPWIDDDGTGTTGTIINNAEKQALYNQIDGAITQPWIDVPFAAANFSALAPMTWTVTAAGVATNRYTLTGRVLVWHFFVSWYTGGNVLGGTPSNTLYMTLPAGLVTAPAQFLAVDYTAGIAGVSAVAGLYATTDGGRLAVSKASSAAFALSDVPGLVMTVVLEVQ